MSFFLLKIIKRLSHRSEEGFGIVEVMVASSIIVIALSVLAYATNLSLIDVAYARQRQAAISLANQAVEKVKALPYSTVAAGLKYSDTTNDPAIQFGTYAGETVPTTNGFVPSPLYPHITYSTIAGTHYTTAIYITNYKSTPSNGILRVTAHVSWLSPARHGKASVSTQTLIFSPHGCLSNSTHPYAAPCEAFFYATGSNKAPGVSLSGSISGLGTLSNTSLSFPQAQANFQKQQLSSVKAFVATSGAQFSSTSAGAHTAQAFSSDDPTTHAPTYASNTTPEQQSNPITQSGSWGTLSLSDTSGDSGTATSTVDASTSNTCNSLNGNAQNTSLPCANSSITQGSSAITSTLDLTPNSNPIGNILLSSISNNPTNIFLSQYLNGTSATSCPSSSAPGCVHAGSTTSISNLTFGSLPTPGDIPSTYYPQNWTGALLYVNNFSNTATAEAGVNAQSPSIASTGTLQYWNGTSYTSQSLSSLPATKTQLSIPNVTLTDPTFNGQNLTITLTPALALGPSSTSTAGTSCAAPSPCSASAGSYLLSGSVQYVVTLGSSTLANFSVNINAGTVVSTATYQAPPNG